MININNIKNNIETLKKELPSLEIDSIFLEQDGKTEKLFYKDEQLHELRSCAKLLVAMAIGIAIDRKMKFDNQVISLNTKIYPIIQNKVNIKREINLLKIQKWTVRDLLTHTTGYESQMMSERYIENIDKDKLLDYALNYDIPYKVGERFAYNNAEPFILSVFFQEAFKINLADFINENIFKKIDILEYEWENYGEYCPGATGLYMKHIDFHKIGQLLLNNGKYNDEQIISEDWINEMCKLQFRIKSRLLSFLDKNDFFFYKDVV